MRTDPVVPKIIINGRQTEQTSTKVQRISMFARNIDKTLQNIIHFDVTGSQNIEPVISLTVRAYDLGIPSLDSEVLVHVFTEQTSSRTMKFIVYEEPSVVNQKQQKFSDLISSITGGSAEIQDIQPYPIDETDSNNVDRADVYEVEYYDRNPKTYEDSEVRNRRSIVDVVITYPTNSVIDMNDITAKLVREQNTSGSNNSTGVPISPRDYEKLVFKNAALFWGLMAVLALIVITILITLCCYCCPCCYYYKKE